MLLYVNDLPSWIQNSMRMFADDTKVWHKIAEDNDSSFLQANLKRLKEWSERWQLKFNSDKCKVMHIGHKFKTSYTRNPAIAEGPRDAGVPVEIW